MQWFRAGTSSHSRAQLTLPPLASGTQEVALVVLEREGEGDWGAYSGSRCLATGKEQGEAAGMEPQAQAGQPRRGWARAGRPGTLIAFGVWELPRGLGGGEANDAGSRAGPGVQSGDATACLRGFGMGDGRARTPSFPLPNAGSRVETPVFPPPPFRRLPLPISGA